MRNVHERVLRADGQEVAAVLESLATPADALWPHDRWPALELSGGLRPGSAGGHAEVRYHVAEHVPGRRVVFRFDPGVGIAGTHAFEVLPQGPSRTLLRHTLEGRLEGGMRLLWPLVVRWLHDALLEDALDRAQRAVEGSVARPARWSPWVRLLHRVETARARRAGTPVPSRG
ncbi:SRPBCC family protein [Kineococcus glutinatus]|uniref:Polyketide cyclase/dehydrase/lipid transport protein n=1 Tax=Kineococcus glutinatus TaxID=1070872 RepID=A0ABP9H7C9_9ACTN